MFRERGSNSARGMDNMEQREDERPGNGPEHDALDWERLKAAASLSKEDNPLIAEQLDRLGIPFPTTLDEWRHVSEEVGRRTQQLQEQMGLDDEQYESNRALIRKQREQELRELQEELDQLRKQHNK